MKKKLALTIIIALVLFLANATFVFADGPENAGGQSDKWQWNPEGGDGIYIWPAELFIGPDYGAGSTETLCSDGTWIDVIPNATLMANGHYFSDEDFTEMDWVSYKFWLSEPVDMILAGGENYIATKFIFLKQNLFTGEIILVNYK